MSVKKFTAATTREALRMVREELGDEAVILSNRKVSVGIEIMAMSNDALSDMTQPNPVPNYSPSALPKTGLSQSRMSSQSSADIPELTIRADISQLNVRADIGYKAAYPQGTRTHYSPATQALVREPASRSARQLQAKVVGSARVGNPGQPRRVIKQVVSPTAPSLSHAPDVYHAMETAKAIFTPEQQGLVKEIKSMRNMLQEQFSCMAWSDMQLRDPKRTRLLRNLVNAGFSPALARQLLDKMPADADMSWVNQVLTHNLHVATQAEDVVVRGGVYALTGPTGVGKTTTTAKLAARAVVRYGADSVALITTDGYRIGALEQLRIYGKILGVAVHVARDTNDLRVTLSGLKHKRLVLIDTMGMGQRDKRLAEQAAMFDAAGVQRLLLLNATSSGDTLDDVVRMYKGPGVIGCIATKLDEAVTLGAVLDVLMRHKMTLHYVANGQRVPEDLHEVNMTYLLHRAFESARKPAAFAAQELDIPALMAGQVSHVQSSHASARGEHVV